MKSKTKEESFYKEAFSRNIGIFNENEQQKIKKAKIAIAGMGGVGGNYLLALVRLGVTNFVIADFDVFETVNINRQIGANVDSLGKKKCVVMKKMAQDINPSVKIKILSEGINKKNIEEFLEGVDVALDGLDFFAIEERLMFFETARKKGIFGITSAPIGFGASLLTFDPQGMTFEKYFNINHKASKEEKIIHFAIGLSPALIQRSYFKAKKIDFVNEKAPSLGLGPLVCSALVGSEVAKIILNDKVRSVPWVSQFDPFCMRYKKSFLFFGNSGLFQRIKIWYIKIFLM